MTMYDEGELRRYARAAAARNSVDPGIFEAQIQQESGFDPSAHNDVSGADGIAQIVPYWHPGVNTQNPWESLDYAAALMGKFLRDYAGDYCIALAAYNAGPGAVAEWGGVPDYPETREYIRIIMAGRPCVYHPVPTPVNYQLQSGSGGLLIAGGLLLVGVAVALGVRGT